MSRTSSIFQRLLFETLRDDVFEAPPLIMKILHPLEDPGMFVYTHAVKSFHVQKRGPSEVVQRRMWALTLVFFWQRRCTRVLIGTKMLISRKLGMYPLVN